MTDLSQALSPELASSLSSRSILGESLGDTVLRLYHQDPYQLKPIIYLSGLVAPQEAVEELVIGGGLHGTTYVCNRKQFQPRLLVYDQMVNGFTSIFGMGVEPVFYLNSRNRPEADTRRPGTPGPLNSIVGGFFQPSEFNLMEYQSQADLALAIRFNLGNYARLAVGIKVVKIEKSGPKNGFFDENGYRYCVSWENVRYPERSGATFTNRVVIATGLGADRMVGKRSARVLSFTDFLKRAGETQTRRPLRGFKRVAIIGCGDSGKVVAEALLGLGPQLGFSNAAEDFVESITWIGQDNLTKEDWDACERSRYVGLGRSFPRLDQPNYYCRVQPEPGRAVRVVGGSRTARVDWMGPQGAKSGRFDYVICCTGFENRVDPDLCSDFDEGTVVWMREDQAVARRYFGEEIYIIGPAAELPLEEGEINPKIDVPENTAAAFRYGDKTALFAKPIRFKYTGEVRSIIIPSSGPIFPGGLTQEPSAGLCGSQGEGEGQRGQEACSDRVQGPVTTS